MQSRHLASVGKDVELQCLVQGDTPIKVVWYKEGKVLQDAQSRHVIVFTFIAVLSLSCSGKIWFAFSRHKLQTTNTASDALSTLYIEKVTKEDDGKYLCYAENSHGTNETEIELIVQGGFNFFY